MGGGGEAGIGEVLETLDVTFYSKFLWLFLIMQRFEMCGKNIWCGASKIRAMVLIECFFHFLNAATFQGRDGWILSEIQHG